MSDKNDMKQIVLSNIIGLNPTGIMAFDGTYKMKGTNDNVRISSEQSKEDLKKTQNNEIVCSSIENFENHNKNNHKNIFFIIILILILIILFIFLYKKNIYI